MRSGSRQTAEFAEKTELWRVPLPILSQPLRDRLPAIPIPLLPPDRDLRCDLAAIFAQTFARGRYDRTLRYGPPPEDRFAEINRPWIASE